MTKGAKMMSLGFKQNPQAESCTQERRHKSAGSNAGHGEPRTRQCSQRPGGAKVASEGVNEHLGVRCSFGAVSYYSFDGQSLPSRIS